MFASTIVRMLIFQVYSPVCGRVGGGPLQSYSNKCVAECQKATVLYEGECGKCTCTMVRPAQVNEKVV